MNRRTLITALPTAFAIPSTGCLQATRNPGSRQGTETLPTRLWLERVSLSESERESVDPIVYGELPDAEREIVRTAIEEDEYTVETGTEPPAVDDLRDRIEERANGGLEVYLRRADAYYRVGFAAGDNIVAHPGR